MPFLSLRVLADLLSASTYDTRDSKSFTDQYWLVLSCTFLCSGGDCFDLFALFALWRSWCRLTAGGHKPRRSLWACLWCNRKDWNITLEQDAYLEKLESFKGFNEDTTRSGSLNCTGQETHGKTMKDLNLKANNYLISRKESKVKRKLSEITTKSKGNPKSPCSKNASKNPSKHS